jgi:RNA polymerase sigma factor (sigma-70 family)
MRAVASLRRVGATPESSPATWGERSARLYEELRRPARAMVRRAYRTAFDDHEVEDIYSSAWLGTLRALERRHHKLSDDEIRKYVLTAVANQASKELRRRRRKPTTPLEAVHAVADDALPPEESAAKREDSRVTRDLLSSLPPRRRAVMLLRYGWGLEPRQVCALVKGLSPRAYRKEITRGVDELTEKLRLVEQGEWCNDREPILKAYAAGLADTEQQRQAQHHLSHCRDCSDFVGRLTRHLHDFGGSLAVPSAADAIDDGRLSLADRLGDAYHRVRESTAGLLGGRGADGAPDGATQALGVAPTARGAGAAGTGMLAKLAGAGTAGKLATLCIGGGVAASACLAAAVIPVRPSESKGGDAVNVVTPGPGPRAPNLAERRPPVVTTPQETPSVPVAPASGEIGGSASADPSDEQPAEAPAGAPIAPSTPPTQEEFGVAAAAPSVSSWPSTSSGSSSSSGGGGATQREFGP